MRTPAIQLILFSLTLLLSLAERPPTKVSILSLSSPSTNLTADALLGKSEAELSVLGFALVPTTHDCQRLLLPEWGAIGVVFAGNISCARLETPAHSVISTARELQQPVNAFYSREEIYIACNGQCTASFESFSVTSTTFDGRRFAFHQHGLFYETKSPRAENVSVLAAVGSITLFLLLLRSRGQRIWLLSTIVVVIFCASGRSDHRKYRLSVREVQDKSRTQVHGYVLLNFAKEVRDKGSSNCIIYTCNAYENVVNLRFSSECDVINFRVTQVLYNTRNVAMNWLKVLVALWIIENEDYLRLVYTDRDLILTKEPLDLVGSHGIVFPDLGGGKPDSAMFIGDGDDNATGYNLLSTWLDLETGETSRRDGGEEQEALLNLHKTRNLKTVPELYDFQCGRNGMNRAQCLLERRYLSWNKSLFFTKVAVELFRIVSNSFFPSRIWMPSVFLYVQGSSLITNTLSCFVSITEVMLYIHLFSPRHLGEIKCSVAGVKAISHGSFDNPFEGTLTAVYPNGIAKRGRIGWRCYEFSKHDERWYLYRVGGLLTFFAAQALIVLLSVAFNIKHFLNPLQNWQLTTEKQD